MPSYSLYFIWPTGHPLAKDDERLLEANHREAARLEAAMIYAGADFPEPPAGFRLLEDGREFYRYPEPPFQEQT